MGKNIYYRFLDDCDYYIANLSNEVVSVNRILEKIKTGLICISNDELKVLNDRYRTNMKEINRLYSDIYSLKVACVINSKVDPCKDALKFYFKSNSEYVVYLLSKMEENGYSYNDNIIEDIRNIYMRSVDIHDKDFNANVGRKIKLSSLIKKKTDS